MRSKLLDLKSAERSSVSSKRSGRLQAEGRRRRLPGDIGNAAVVLGTVGDLSQADRGHRGRKSPPMGCRWLAPTSRRGAAQGRDRVLANTRAGKRGRSAPLAKTTAVRSADRPRIAAF